MCGSVYGHVSWMVSLVTTYVCDQLWPWSERFSTPCCSLGGCEPSLQLDLREDVEYVMNTSKAVFKILVADGQTYKIIFTL